MIDWPRWSAETADLVLQYGYAPWGTPEKDWRRFAAAICVIPAISGTGPPRPENYETWQAWAHPFNQNLRLLGL